MTNIIISDIIVLVPINNLTREEGEMKKKVICITCRKEVEVEPVRCGRGHIAIYPVCGKLAYNSSD